MSIISCPRNEALSAPVFLDQEVADLIGADPKDIVFTSGATESNNMSIKGVARFHKEKKRHIITTQTVSCAQDDLSARFDLRSSKIGTQVCP